MSHIGITAIEVKLGEAGHHFDTLGKIERATEFYAVANSFVSTARSVLHIAQFQLGFEDPKSHGGGPFGLVEECERKNFDNWFKSSSEIAAVLNHPLARARNDVAHRSGQAGFIHIPKTYPGAGMPVSHSTPFKQSPFVIRRAGRSGRNGLPPRDVNCFYYLDDHCMQHNALPYCAKYLELLRAAVRLILNRPWV